MAGRKRKNHKLSVPVKDKRKIPFNGSTELVRGAVPKFGGLLVDKLYVAQGSKTFPLKSLVGCISFKKQPFKRKFRHTSHAFFIAVQNRLSK